MADYGLLCEKWALTYYCMQQKKTTIFQTAVIKICRNLEKLFLTSQFIRRMLKHLNKTVELLHNFYCRVTHYFLKKIQNCQLRMLSYWYKKIKFVYYKFCSTRQERSTIVFLVNRKKLKFRGCFQLLLYLIVPGNRKSSWYYHTSANKYCRFHSLANLEMCMTTFRSTAPLSKYKHCKLYMSLYILFVQIN